MNINYKQPQFELFPSSNTVDETGKPKYLLANITLSTENVVLLSILCIILAVIAFALGVEHGKRIALFEQMSKVNSRNTTSTPLKITPQAATQQALTSVKTQNISQAQGTMPRTVGVPTSATPNQGIVQTVLNSTVNPLSVNADKPYTIQIASYKDQKFAQREGVKFQTKGIETQVIQKGSYVILCVGHFSTRQEADNFARRLRPTYKDYVVRRL